MRYTITGKRLRQSEQRTPLQDGARSNLARTGSRYLQSHVPVSPFDQTRNTNGIALPWTEVIKMQHATYLSTVHQVNNGTRDEVAGPMVRTVQALPDELPHVLFHIIPHPYTPR